MRRVTATLQRGDSGCGVPRSPQSHGTRGQTSQPSRPHLASIAVPCRRHPETGTWPQPPKPPGTQMSPSRARYQRQSSPGSPGSGDGSFALSPIRRMLRAISAAGGWFPPGNWGWKSRPQEEMQCHGEGVSPTHPPWGPTGDRTGVCGSLETQARWAGRRTRGQTQIFSGT